MRNQMALTRLLAVSAVLLMSASACSTGHYTRSIPGSYNSSFRSGLEALKAKDYETAEANLAFAAKSGHPRALIAYGDLFAKGRGIERDPVRAKALLDEAYGKSSDYKGRAALSLGRLLLEGGEGSSGKLEASPEQARLLLVDALERGETRAASTLGKIYDEGIGANRNVDKAIEYYDLVASEDTTAARGLASLLVETDAPKKRVADAADHVVTQLEQRAEKGNDRAWLQLADIFSRGEIVDTNLTRAIGYLQNASAEDSPDVLLRLAKVYDRLGYTAELRSTLQKAADLGDMRAQAKFARLLLKGGTDNTNGPVGRHYAEQAIAQGSEAAMVYLGNALLKGDVLAPDPQAGEALLRRASATEYTSAMTALGGWLIRGQVDPRFPGEGQQLLEAAAEQGSKSAMSALGFAYHSGRGLPQNEKVAMEWLQRAADAGHAKAQKFLSELQSGA
ncbi:MAG: tetratricopeptide repeat protein [Geminicoccaceae bacterium]